MFTRIQWRIASAYVILIVLMMSALGLYLVQLLRRGGAGLLPADALANQVALTIVVATAVTILLAVVLAVLVARPTIRPVEQLTWMARRVAAGHLGAQLDATTRDEVGQLVAAFNAMAGELQATIGAIDAQRAELTAILAGMADGVMIVDGQRRVVALNRAAERLLEIGDDAARGRSVAEVVRHHDLVARLAAARRDDGPSVIEVGRDRRQVQVVLTPLQVGRETRYVILFQDVTELRRAEAIRRDFVANVSHELRTPLASLRALVETLEDGALDDPPAAREFLGRMHVEVDGLTQMVGELLELARIESGRVQLRFARGDVGEIVHVVTARLRPQAERQGVALSIDIPEGPAEAVVDAGRLETVVVNLVHNAIKFTPPGGSVRVTVEPRDGEIALIVADTGIGVDPHDLPRLFERFYKTDRSRATSGTGLGLAIVKHLVQAHGGKVWAESPGPGQGATFGVSLPVGGPTGESANGHVRGAAGL